MTSPSGFRPARFGGPYWEPGNNRLQEELASGLDPDDVGERVVRAIRDRELYMFTHMQSRDWLRARHQRIVDAFNACGQRIAERSADRAGHR